MYTLGIDIGSTTSKCVILDESLNIVGTSLIIGGTGSDGPERALKDVYEKSDLTEKDIDFVVVTGYGRSSYKNADAEVSELTCHARGVTHLYPSVRTIIDIGGQDAKVIAINDRGKMSNFVMNDKCAAGTGRFLDVMAIVLQIDINELEKLARKSDKPAKISSTCTVFAESEVISQLSVGTSKEDIIAGVCESVASRVASLAKRVGIKEDIFMSGGVARNGGVRDAMSRILDMEILYDKNSQLMGAVGAALVANEMLKEEEED